MSHRKLAYLRAGYMMAVVGADASEKAPYPIVLFSMQALCLFSSAHKASSRRRLHQDHRYCAYRKHDFN